MSRCAKGNEIEVPIVLGSRRSWRIATAARARRTARIVLLSADNAGTLTIMRQVGCAKATIWRWQERFMAEGVDGLLRDKSRPPDKAPLAGRWSIGWWN